MPGRIALDQTVGESLARGTTVDRRTNQRFDRGPVHEPFDLLRQLWTDFAKICFANLGEVGPTVVMKRTPPSTRRWPCLRGGTTGGVPIWRCSDPDVCNVRAAAVCPAKVMAPRTMADMSAFSLSPEDQSHPVQKSFLIVRLFGRLTRQIPSR